MTAPDNTTCELSLAATAPVPYPAGFLAAIADGPPISNPGVPPASLGVHVDPAQVLIKGPGPATNGTTIHDLQCQSDADSNLVCSVTDGSFQTENLLQLYQNLFLIGSHYIAGITTTNFALIPVV